ncbi:hypothetical protein [Cryobacterium sp. N21]|uniref:hypothetical protein n=1 Tax=Cryobacterium sp. N21 TaxID=2048289 RepID=UPI001124DE70|nr:hypothetical protein [Cryobacterium sp. N21]
MNESGWRYPFRVDRVDETSQQPTVTGRTRDIVRAEPRQIPIDLMPLFLELTGEDTSDEWARGAGLYIRHVRKTTKARPSFSRLFNKLLSQNEAGATAPRKQKYFFNQIVAIHWRRRGWIWFTRDSCSLSEGPASKDFGRAQRAKARASRFVVTELRAFRLEAELEDYLRAHPSILGADLLIIGKQVQTTSKRRIDLLAIDATGRIHIIELKVDGTTLEIVGQVTDYLFWVQQLDSTEIITIAARGEYGIDLEFAFCERFGHPLPVVINQSQVLTIIAASIDLRTQRSMMAIRHSGLLTTMFRYTIQSDTVSLIPCCRDGEDVEATRVTPSLQALRKGVTAPKSHLPWGIKIHIDDSVREFWLTHAPHFPTIVLFSVIYADYEQWVRARADEGLELVTVGLFGRQLVAIVAESDEWVHVFIPTGSTMKSLAALKSLPSTRPDPADGHHTGAYLRNPGYRESER